MEKNIHAENEMTFESAMSRLEEIVGKLEGGTVTLDASLKLYEEGIELVRFCSDTLDKAEKKIKIVKNGSDGTKTEEDFQ
jgi:exodeoxyribonuclease VII small subunit